MGVIRVIFFIEHIISCKRSDDARVDGGFRPGWPACFKKIAHGHENFIISQAAMVRFTLPTITPELFPGSA
jgi:hypothetical protein